MFPHPWQMQAQRRETTQGLEQDYQNKTIKTELMFFPTPSYSGHLVYRALLSSGPFPTSHSFVSFLCF